MSATFEQLLADNLNQSNFRKGSVHVGIISKIESSKVLVNIGLKSDGIVPREEFLDGADELPYQVGDNVEVALYCIDDGLGETKVSYEQAKRIRTWENLSNANESGATVTGYVINKIRGGFIVDLGHVEAFMPGSLSDIRPVQELAELAGRELQFKIIKFDQARNNVVLSRRAVLVETLNEGSDGVLSQFQPGSVVKGVVRNLTYYGAFIDLGPIDGLLHCGDIAWERVNHPSDELTVGQEIDVKVLGIDYERLRVSLGLKQLSDDPWKTVATNFPEGTKHSGVITVVKEYGAFVKLDTGIEGLIHSSQLYWSTRFIEPSTVVQPGQQVDVMVLEVDAESRRISLSLKQCIPNPWEEFAANHSVGERVQGTVRKVTDFGIFVRLGDQIDGLVHIGDVSWDNESEAITRYKVDQEIETVFLNCDSVRERVSLGIKQLEKNPLDTYIEHKKKGTKIEVTVVQVEERRAEVELEPGLIAVLPGGETAIETSDLRTAIRPGDVLEVMVKQVDMSKGRVTVSAKRVQEADQTQALNEHRESVASETKGGTLGDVLKDLDHGIEE